MSLPPVLFSADEIAARVAALARMLAARPQTPEVAAPVLVGSFVFAADLMRALAEEGIALHTEMLWLRSYGAERTGGEIRVLVPPGAAVKGRRVLLIDGVLDTGRTIAEARRLLLAAGAADIVTVVAVDKRRADAVATADHALFADVQDFIVGYGMDDAGKFRALPYIGKVES